MTALLAIVGTADEATAALTAGADQAAVLGDADPGADATGVGRMIWPAQGDMDEAVDILQAGSGPVWAPLRPAWSAAIRAALAGGRTVVGCIDAETAGGGTDWVADASGLGLGEVLVATRPFAQRRLLDRLTVSDLATFARLGHAAGLRVGFSGALEAPDVPRLKALAPDTIGFGAALRDARAGFDGGRLGAIRRLMDGVDSPAPGDLADEAPDRIFVRDWTIPMSIGVYARERGQMQRVRFTVEACVATAGPVAGLGGIVSYDLITDAIARLAADHVDLVEDLAERLADTVLGHKRVLSLDITVEKLDVGPGTVGCRIFRRRATV